MLRRKSWKKKYFFSESLGVPMHVCKSMGITIRQHTEIQNNNICFTKILSYGPIVHPAIYKGGPYLYILFHKKIFDHIYF